MELHEAMERIRKMEPPVQREAIKCIREHREEAIPLLLERLRDSLRQTLTVYENDEDEDGAAWGYWYAMFLLAEFRVREAFEPLAALLELDEDTTEWLLNDAITEDFPCVLASCAQPEDFVRLRELALTGSRGWMMNRLAALEAASILYAEGDVAHDDMHALLCDALAQGVRQNDPEMVAFVACNAVDIGMFEMKDELQPLFEQGKADWQIAGNWNDFARDSRFDQAPASALRKFRQNIYRRKIDNAIAVIESWPGFKPSTKAANNVLAVPQAAENQRQLSASSRTYPNDPCPCGSGKKYKKCCMEY